MGEDVKGGEKTGKVSGQKRRGCGETNVVRPQVSRSDGRLILDSDRSRFFRFAKG